MNNKISRYFCILVLWRGRCKCDLLLFSYVPIHTYTQHNNKVSINQHKIQSLNTCAVVLLTALHAMQFCDVIFVSAHDFPRAHFQISLVFAMALHLHYILIEYIRFFLYLTIHKSKHIQYIYIKLYFEIINPFVG